MDPLVGSFNPNSDPPSVPVVVPNPPVPVSGDPIVFDEITIDSDDEDEFNHSNGVTLPADGCYSDKHVKKEDSSKIPEVLTLSSDDEDDNLVTSETMSVNADSPSASVKIEGPSKESIGQFIDKKIKEKGNLESFYLRCRKVGDDIELCIKELDIVHEEFQLITQTCDKLTPKETHITGGGIINPKDTSLTINEPVQRVVSINEIQRKISKEIMFDPELARVNLGRLHPITNYPDIDIVLTKSAEELQEIHKLPKTGAIIRKPLNVGDQVYAVSNPLNLAKSVWQAATIIETHKIDGKMNYTVTYEDSFKPCLVLKGHQVAYRHTPSVMLSVKCRVIATVEIDIHGAPKRLVNFSGIIAEVPRRSNSFRYLVFFDNGSVSYVKTDCVFLIAVENMAWLEDVPENSRTFLKKYFTDLPEKALVKYYVGSKDFVLINDKWVPGKVKKVDCSLIQFYFRSLMKYEWLFRGSPRLKPLSGLLRSESQLNSQGKARAPRKKTSIFDNNRERPFVQYTRDDGNSSDDDLKRSPNKSGVIVRPRLDPFSQRSQVEFELFPELFQPPHRLSISKMFTPHRCTITCINREYEVISRYRDINPFAVPVICGWDRQICSLNALKKRREIFYIGPCGRRLRSIEEVDRFLKLTDSGLPIDLFSFHPKLRLYVDLNGQRVQGCYYYEPDVANGMENHSLSCINWVNDEPITPGFEYWPTRFPGRDISIETDPHFLLCCDCTDNCRDKTKCDCQRLTRDASELVRSISSEYEEDSYRYRRLQNAVTTGIWECNANCACNKNCANRVVQNGIRVRLQIFRTDKKGWGIRCLHDIPPGAFISIYAAEVLNEELADECGSNYGDEYLADLDYIENVERFKDHYEEAVIEEISSSSSNESSSPPTDHETESYHPHGQKSRVRSHRRSTGSSANKKMRKEKEKMKIPKLGGKPYRELFHESSAYSLDAKRKGNVGRYFNHSCDPNCYVQNVFIDSHDLRFPWVALFARKFIPAFTELNWDYNYEIIEGRKLWCYCGSSNCRGRLL